MIRSTKRKGTAAVEFAVLLIVLLPTLLGLWEIGRLVAIYQVVANAAREGGRQASTGERTAVDVQKTILTYLKNEGFSQISEVVTDPSQIKQGGKVYVNIKVYDSTGTYVPGLDPINADQNNKIEVTATILYSDAAYSTINYFLTNSTTVSTTVVWHCMRDIPLVVNQTIPLY